MRVAISGASGLTGSELSKTLKALGHEVVPMVRRKEQEGLYWSVEAGEIDEAALKGVDAFVLLAGEPIGPDRWTPERRKRIRTSRVDGIDLVTSAIAKLEKKPQVVIQASAVGYYGNTGDQAVTEESPPGSGFLSEVCQDWEAAAAPVKEIETRWVALRLGHILTKGDGLLGAMETPFKLGAGGPLGSGEQYWSWITLNDLVRLIVHAIVDSRFEGPINAVTPHPLTNKAFSKELGAALSRPSFLPAPKFALKLAFGKEQAEEMLLSGQRVIPKALLDLGFDFAFPEAKGALEEIYKHQSFELVATLKKELKAL